MEATTIIIIVVGLLLLTGLFSAFCRGLKNAYEAQLTNEDRAQRAQAFYISQASRYIRNLNDGRQVRVTTITRDTDRVAYEIYEIHVPSRTNQNQTETLQLHQNNNNNNSIFSRSYNPNRLGRLGRPGQHPSSSPDQTSPPPAFNIALQVSSPIPPCNNLSEEPPPSYEESKRLQLRY